MSASRETDVRRFATAVAIAAFGVILMLAAWVAARMLLLIFGGVLLAILLRGLGEVLARYTRLRERWATWIVIAAFAAVFGLGGWYFSSQLGGEFDELAASLSDLWTQLRDQLDQTAIGTQLLSQIDPGEMPLGDVGRIIGVVLAAVSGLVISLFIGVYVAADPTVYHDGLLRLVPMRMRRRADEILRELHATLRAWLIGTFGLMIIVGVATYIGLSLLGIPLALSLAVIAFALEFIPYVGPILAAVPAVLVASTLGVQDMLFVVLLYWGIQSFEGYILSPLVLQRTVRIPPMLTIGAQAFLAAVVGVVGVIFATPLTACAMVLVKRLYVEDTLGDKVDK